MRWLIFFLLVLNVLTFTWFVFQGDRSDQLAVRDKSEKFDFDRAPPLQLLGELTASEIKSRDVRNVQPAIKVPEVSVSTEVAQIEDSEVSEVSEVSEGGEAGQNEVSEVIVYDENETVNAQVGKCALIGYFPEMVTAKQAKGRLLKQGLESRVVLVPKQLPAINWVYISPRNSRKEALAVLKSLQENNIDSFLIADGEYKNGISLGFFSKLESAGAVMKERRRQGYEVSITRKTREQKTFWVAFDEKNSLQVDEDLINSLKGDVSDLKKQEKSCRDVALLQIIE